MIVGTAAMHICHRTICKTAVNASIALYASFLNFCSFSTCFHFLNNLFLALHTGTIVVGYVKCLEVLL